MRILAALLGLFLAPAPGFRMALPGYAWQFPRDEGPHAEFANEWWYFTGNLSGAQGQKFGFELTFFRVSPQPGTPVDKDLYFTHFAVTDIAHRRFEAAERAHRGDWQQAGVANVPGGIRLFNENWEADFDASGPRRLRAAWGGMQIDLALANGPRIMNGINGYSQKGRLAGEASYYYSCPRLPAQGRVDGQPASGTIWMDHEFASNQLEADQQGWDWMGLQLDDGSNLMLFNLRRTNGMRDPHSAGTIDGQPLAAADFAMAPMRWWQGYPIAWHVVIPSRHLDLAVIPAMDNQEVHAPLTGADYWEGAVSIAGAEGKPAGRGYLELTGYRQRIRIGQ